MSDPLDDLIDAAARALDLPIEPEWKAAVKTNLAVTLAPRRSTSPNSSFRTRPSRRRCSSPDAMDLTWSSANAIAYAVHDGQVSARDVVAGALARIAAKNAALNAFTAVTEQRALARADAIDAARKNGERLGPLAGVPFAVKNLFDVAGLPTVAGSKINRDRAAGGARLAADRAAGSGRRGARRALSTWASTPMISPAKTSTTAPRAIRTTRRA